MKRSPSAHTVLFDLDGTLTDSAEGIVASARYALQKLGIREADPAQLRRFIGPPLKSSFRDYYGVPDSLLDEAVRWYRERYVPRGMYENALYPGVPEMLETLKNRDVRMFIATAKPQPMAEKIAAHFEIEAYFTAIVGARMDETRSEKEEVIRYLLGAYLSGNRDGVVMVGDRKHDMIGANRAGIPAIGAAWGYGGRDELMESGAAALARTPVHLCEVLEAFL